MTKAIVIEDSERVTGKHNPVGSNPKQVYGPVELLHTRSDEMLQNLEQHQQLLFMSRWEQPKLDFLTAELEMSAEDTLKNDMEQENSHSMKQSEEVHKEFLKHKTFETWKWLGQNEMARTKSGKEADSGFRQKEFVLEKQIKNLKTIMESKKEIRGKQGNEFEKIKKLQDISGIPLFSDKFHANIRNIVHNTQKNTLPLEGRNKDAMSSMTDVESMISFRERQLEKQGFLSPQQSTERKVKKEVIYDINELHHAYQQGSIYNEKKENAIAHHLLKKMNDEKGMALLQKQQEDNYVRSGKSNIRALDSTFPSSETPMKEISSWRENKKSTIFDLLSEQILKKDENSEANKLEDKVNLILHGKTKNKNALFFTPLFYAPKEENVMWSGQEILMKQLESGRKAAFVNALAQEQKALAKQYDRNALLSKEKKTHFYGTAEKKLTQIPMQFFNRTQDKTGFSSTDLNNFPFTYVDMGLSSVVSSATPFSLQQKNRKKQISADRKYRLQLNKDILEKRGKSDVKDFLAERGKEGKESNPFYWGENQGVETSKVNEKRQLFDSSQFSASNRKDRRRDSTKPIFSDSGFPFEKENDLLKVQNTTKNTDSPFLSPSSNYEKGFSKVHISLGEMNVTVQGNSTKEKEDILLMIQDQLPELTNEIAAKLAVLLSQVFSNMKARPQ